VGELVQLEVKRKGFAELLISVTYNPPTLTRVGHQQSPTLGAHTHDHGFWVGIGFVHPCIQLQIGVKLLGCREYANQEVLRAEANDGERLFICPIQPRLGVGG
jgi:hypothetical protein